MATATESLVDIAKSLPGYDPWQQAGDCYFDEDAAQFAIDFIETCCTFTKGKWKGQPFILEDWEKAIVANLWGWKRPDGLRRYRECLLYVPRKNGKSEFAAALIVLMLYSSAGLLEGQRPEPGAEIYGAAGKRDQTKYIFEPVKHMIMQNQGLRKYAKLYTHSIQVGDAVYLKISSEATTEHGGSTQLAVIDELHAQPDSELVDVLQTSMGSRDEPLSFYVTTADYEREGSICNAKHDKACKVRDNILHDPEFLPVIYEATKDDDWTDPAVWAQANPNLGISKRLDYMKSECRKAKDEPAYENTYRRLHLNVRTEQAERLLPVDRWDACRGELPDLAGCRCWAGLDLGATRDFTAFVPVFPLEDDRYAIKPFFWIPESAARKRKEKLGATYLMWERAGALRITEGDEIDYDKVEADIAEFAKHHKLEEIAADRLFQGAQIIQHLNEKHGITTFEHGQGFLDMAIPTRTFLEYVGDRKVVHDGNPVMRWMIGNLTGKQDEAGNWKPDKKRAADKIDGAVAGIMGLGRAVEASRGPQRSYYEDHPEAEVV